MLRRGDVRYKITVSAALIPCKYLQLRKTYSSKMMKAFSSPGLERPVCRSVPFSKKDQMRCMFCGGEQCTKCGLSAYLQLKAPAIQFLHSAWISDSIIGMQRPNDVVLKERDGIAKFKAAKVTAIFNLTEPGEHPYCGTGTLEHSGFPYSPEILMAAGIKHFNFGWPDMTVPSISLMMNIAKVASNEINNGGKIAVHCHAGFGRTGVAIACIMIYKDQLESTQVITFVRNRRPGSIQTAAQEKFVIKFERSFKIMQQVFPTNDAADLSNLAASPTSAAAVSSDKGKIATMTMYRKTLGQTLQDQQFLLTAAEEKMPIFAHVHKVVHFVTLALSSCVRVHYNMVCLAITGLSKLVPKANTWEFSYESSFVAKTTSGSNKSTRSFMVVTNALSEISEETVLSGMKDEININKWSKFMAVGDVVGGALKMSQESVNQMNKLTSSFRKNASNSNMQQGGTGTTPAAAAGAAGGGGGEEPPNQPESPAGGSMRRRGPSFRQNSLRQNTDNELNNSKKVSVNCYAQLLLDWLETRQDALCDEKVITALVEAWRRHFPNIGQLGSTESMRKDIQNAAPASVALWNDVYDLLPNLFNRSQRCLLSTIVNVYRDIRQKGIEEHEEIPAMDILVGLRFSIALIHARKSNPQLIRQRSLNLEIVKVFILKHADMERVLINNINFAEEHYESVKLNVGPELVEHLDIVLRTLELLIENGWSYTPLGSSVTPHRSPAAIGQRRRSRVGWNEADITPRGDATDGSPDLQSSPLNSGEITGRTHPDAVTGFDSPMSPTTQEHHNNKNQQSSEEARKQFHEAFGAAADRLNDSNHSPVPSNGSGRPLSPIYSPLCTPANSAKGFQTT